MSTFAMGWSCCQLKRRFGNQRRTRGHRGRLGTSRSVDNVPQAAVTGRRLPAPLASDPCVSAKARMSFSLTRNVWTRADYAASSLSPSPSVCLPLL